MPLGSAWKADVSYQLADFPGSTNYHYGFLSAGRSLGRIGYALTQYRLTVEDGEATQHQAYQYLSFTPARPWRFGACGAYTFDDERGDNRYADGFVARTFADDAAAIRLEALYYETEDDFSYQDYRAFYYQRLGEHWLIRVGYRYYRDNQDYESHAPGLKVIWYASERLSLQAGYVRYLHSTDAEMNDFLGGFNVVF